MKKLCLKRGDLGRKLVVKTIMEIEKGIKKMEDCHWEMDLKTIISVVFILLQSLLLVTKYDWTVENVKGAPFFFVDIRVQLLCWALCIYSLISNVNSWYGQVADLSLLVAEIHKLESHYINNLVGQWQIYRWCFAWFSLFYELVWLVVGASSCSNLLMLSCRRW